MQFIQDGSGEELFRELVNPRTVEPAEALLRRYIVERGLQPGDRLPSEHELAAAMRGSRVVVRKALHGLEALGLIESRVGSGWYIRAFDVSHTSRALSRSLAFHPSAVLELLDVWRPAEAELVRTLPKRLQEADFDALDRLVAQMRLRAAAGEPFYEDDGTFHRRIVAASGNRFALALVDMYWNLKSGLYQGGFPRHAADHAPEIAEAHGELVRALRAGDGDSVRELMREHHDETEKRFRAWLESHGSDATSENGTAIQATVRAALLGPSAMGTH